MQEQNPTKNDINKRIDKSFERPIRELILDLLKERKKPFSTPHIALELGIESKTVSRHVSKLFRKGELLATDPVFEVVPLEYTKQKKEYRRRKMRFYVLANFPHKTVEIEYLIFDKNDESIDLKREIKKVKPYNKSSIESRGKTKIILKCLQKQKRALLVHEIAKKTNLAKRQVASSIFILVSKGNVYKSDTKFSSKGHLYFTTQKQYQTRIDDPYSLFEGNKRNIIKRIETCSRLEKRFVSHSELSDRFGAKFGYQAFNEYISDVVNLVPKIKAVSVLESKYYYHLDHLTDDEIRYETARLNGKIRPHKEGATSSGLLNCISKERIVLLDDKRSFGEELWDANQNNQVGSEAWFLNLRYMIYLGISQNRRKGKGPNSIRRLFDQLRESTVATKHSEYDSKKRVNSSQSLIFYYLYKGIFNLKHEEIIEFLNHEKVWQRTLELNKVPSQPQASNFKKFIGNEKFVSLLEAYASQIKTLLGVDELKENIIFKFIKEYSYKRYTKRNDSGRYSGWNLFMDFLYSFGVVSQIMNSLRKEKRYNAKYSLETMATTYLCKAPLDVKNNYKLGFKLKQNGHLEEYFNKDTPHANTFARNYEYLDIAKMERLSQSIAKRSRRFSHSAGRLGIDGTKIRVFGSGYKDNADGKGVGIKLFDNKYRSEILCIYLVFVYDVDTREPICFRLVDSEEDANRKELLLEMIEDSVAIIGKDNLKVVLFDREFYKFPLFNELTERGYPFITPAEDAGTPKKMKDSLLDGEFTPISKGNNKEKVAERMLVLKGYEGMIRQVILRKEFIEDDELKVVRHDFLTNIADVSAKEVLEWYGKRWNIENFYKELKNEWYLKYFPCSTPHAVKCYVFFILITYSLVNIFKRMIGKGRHQLETIRDIVFIQWVDITIHKGEYRFSFYLARDGIDTYEFTKKRMEMMADAI